MLGRGFASSGGDSGCGVVVVLGNTDAVVGGVNMVYRVFFILYIK